MINIYIESSLKDLKRQSGIVCLLFENGENTGQTSTQYGKVLEKTKYQAELISLKNALKMIRSKKNLVIYTDCQYMAAAFEQDWISKWQQNGWKTAKGRDVKNQEEWQAILTYLQGNKPQFKVREMHSYKLWMRKEIEKRLNK